MALSIGQLQSKEQVIELEQFCEAMIKLDKAEHRNCQFRAPGSLGAAAD